jgi:hypothetical protein
MVNLAFGEVEHAARDLRRGRITSFRLNSRVLDRY